MKKLLPIIVLAISTFFYSNLEAQTNMGGISMQGINANEIGKLLGGNLSPTSAGVRLEAVTGSGVGLGLTLLQDLNKYNKIEGMLTINNRDWRVTGLYEFYQPVPNISDLSWFVGAGAHMGKAGTDPDYTLLNDIMSGNIDFNEVANGNSAFFVGVDGIAGLNYKVSQMPINVSVDLKPALNLNNHPNKIELGIGVSVRWMLGSGGGGGKGGGNGSGSGASKGEGNGGGQGTTPRKGTVRNSQHKGDKPHSNTSTTTRPTTKPNKGTNTRPTTKPTPNPTPDPGPTPNPTPNGGNNNGNNNGNGNSNGESWGDDGG